MTEDPLGANPYLCVSAEILVTPLTRKSNGARGKPASFMNGTKRCQGEASLFHEWHKKPSQTSVDMDRYPMPDSESRDGFNVVNDPMGELRAGPYQHAGAGVDGASHGIDIDRLGLRIYLDVFDHNVQHGSSLVKSGVGSDGHHNVGVLDPFLLPRPVTIGFCGQDDGFGSRMMDSVPPVEMHPQESGPPLNKLQHIRTTSASIFLMPGNVPGWRGLDQAVIP